MLIVRETRRTTLYVRVLIHALVEPLVLCARRSPPRHLNRRRFRRRASIIPDMKLIKPANALTKA